jgi:hypothetical protein
MPRKPLRSQLNQVRSWVRQGRTDAWIAHQLDVPASELREFRRRHGLESDGEEETGEVDLRDEIEAEIEAATLEEAIDEDEDQDESDDSGDTDDEGQNGDSDDSGAPRRRRRRRRGRGKRAGGGLQASFDHGDADGYGLWMDPAIADDPVYSEHWAGKRRVEVTIEPERIVIVRSED